jgi:hypothetical protein
VWQHTCPVSSNLTWQFSIRLSRSRFLARSRRDFAAARVSRLASRKPHGLPLKVAGFDDVSVFRIQRRKVARHTGIEFIDRCPL